MYSLYLAFVCSTFINMNMYAYIKYYNLIIFPFRKICMHILIPLDKSMGNSFEVSILVYKSEKQFLMTYTYNFGYI